MEQTTRRELDFRLYEQRYRRKFVYAAIPLICAVVIYFLEKPLQTIFSMYKVEALASIVIAILLAFSLLLLLMLYLQTGFKRPTILPVIADNSINVNNEMKTEIKLLKTEFSNVYKKIEMISQSNYLETKNDITTEQKEDLVNLITGKIKTESSQKILEEMEQRFKDQYEEKQKMNSLVNYFEQIIKRLNSEVSVLNRRSNLNLALGILITLAGIVLLYNFVYSLEMHNSDSVQFLFFFIPKLALVIFIETFAYFFLTLYKTSLAEIKHYQKEMTNIESQKIALFTSLEQGREDTVSNVLNVIMTLQGSSSHTNEYSKFESNLTNTIKEVLSTIVDKRFEDLKTEKN